MTQSVHTRLSSKEGLQTYLQEIHRYEPLSTEEERDLTRRARDGDTDARNRLVEANLRFVVSRAVKYQGQGLPLADLIAEGNLGLLRAAERFDETRGYRFVSYAVWWIHQAILEALMARSRVIRLPVSRIGRLRKIYKTCELLGQDMEDTKPNFEEIANESGLSVEQVEDVLKWRTRIQSLDVPFDEEDDRCLLDVLPDESVPLPEDMLVARSLREEIESAIDTLDEREAVVSRLYFGLGQDDRLTLGEIGARYGVSRECIRQIKDKALKKLRYSARRRRLQPYLETD